jgi:ATP-binding cassette subfamily F protein 3
LLTLANVRLRRGPQVLVDAASTGIFRGEKVGIVGRNGSGKSTLLALIKGELLPDAGEYSAPPNLAMASVAQELPDSDAPLVEYILDGDLELREVEAQLAQAEQKADGVRIGALHAEYERLAGYAGRSRAAELAAGLGFAPEEIDWPACRRPVRQLSGGLKMRANLARALMRRSDLLLLDEPTNHLDLDAVLWLEQWLRNYPGTLLLVSHDREFLDGVVSRILLIEAGRLTSYAGNYSSFEVQHAAEGERTRALIARQERETARVTSFIERFRAQATKARQVQSRLKALARLGEISAVQPEAGFEWEFAAPAKLPCPLLTLERLAAGYGARRIIENVSLSVNPGDRIGILGRNGAGKSTLMRVLAGQLAPLAGALTAAPDVMTGFFAQIELEHLDSESTALAELVRRGGPEVAQWLEQQRRDHLGRFGFRGDRVFEPTGRFSGGERARLALAILVARRPNLLLLDEPTNHLDLEMRHALLVALQEFPGAVVVVSHDRTLLRGACDSFLLVANGSVTPFDGDLDDYASWLAKNGKARAAPDSDATTAAPTRQEQRRLDAEARNRLTPLRNEQKLVEGQLEKLGAERARLETALADPETYTTKPAEEGRRLTLRHADVVREIGTLEERWLEVMSELEERSA